MRENNRNLKKMALSVLSSSIECNSCDYDNIKFLEKAHRTHVAEGGYRPTFRTGKIMKSADLDRWIISHPVEAVKIFKILCKACNLQEEVNRVRKIYPNVIPESDSLCIV